MKRIIATLVCSLVPVVGLAIDAGKAFDDPVLQARYETIVAEVRCPKCQNQSVKDSNALPSDTMRREIRRLLAEGRTDQEIYAYLVQRYGEFALYRPRASGKTLVLWLAPAILLLAGAFVVVRVIRGRMTLPIDDESLEA